MDGFFSGEFWYWKRGVVVGGCPYISATCRCVAGTSWYALMQWGLRSASAPREFIRADPPIWRIWRIWRTLGFFIKFLMRFLIDNFRLFSIFSWILGRFRGPTWSQNPIKIWKNVGSGRVLKFIPFLSWFLSDFRVENEMKIDANLMVFLLCFRSAENAGNTVNIMVSEVFCISDSIENYMKIDVKT